MANCETDNNSDSMNSDTTIRVVNPRSMAKLIEPYNTCSMQDGLSISAELFTARFIESFERFVEVLRPRMKAYKERDMTATFESPCYPVDDHFTINGNGLLSVCVRVHDDKNYHQLVTYDHTTQELKKLGRIRRHKFEMNVDASVICLNDPCFVEGILGALSDDGQFFVVLAHSKGLCMLNVFDVPNTTCLLEFDCSHVSFLECGPMGIAINPKTAEKGQFNIAILSEKMEVRLWTPTTHTGSAIKLEDTSPSFYFHRYLINPRESAIKFSPDGRLLSVLAYFDQEHQCCVCTLMDSSSLDIYYLLPYNNMYAPLCSLFPCFTQCSSKLAMFACMDANQIMDIDDYKLLFYEIPFRIENLKKLCKLAILNIVDTSKLGNLPLSKDMIAYLSDNNQTALPDNDLLPGNDLSSKKHCNIM